MVGSHKILTVSYGTFSCTLEGFDDSFGTMKAIAEYFRDLAAEDRYFGATPPIPDAEMLARIAEREIARRVEARMDSSGIVLRAGNSISAVVAAQTLPETSTLAHAAAAHAPAAQAPAAQTPAAHAPATRTPAATVPDVQHAPVQPTAPVAVPVAQAPATAPARETAAVAADLPPATELVLTAQESNLGIEASAPSLPAAEPLEELPVLEALSLDPAGPEAEADQTGPAPLLAAEGPAGVAPDAAVRAKGWDDTPETVTLSPMPPAARAPEPARVIPRPRPQPVAARPAVAEPVPAAPVLPAHPDANSIAAKLQRIRAVVGRNAIDQKTQGEEPDLMEHFDPNPQAPVDEIEGPSHADPDLNLALATVGLGATVAAPEPMPAVAAVPAAPAAETPAQPIRARVIRMRRADFDRAVSEGRLDPVPAAASRPVQQPAAIPATPAASALSPEAEADLMAELAEMERETGSVLSPDHNMTQAADAETPPRTEEATPSGDDLRAMLARVAVQSDLSTEQHDADLTLAEDEALADAGQFWSDEDFAPDAGTEAAAVWAATVDDQSTQPAPELRDGAGHEAEFAGETAGGLDLSTEIADLVALDTVDADLVDESWTEESWAEATSPDVDPGWNEEAARLDDQAATEAELADVADLLQEDPDAALNPAEPAARPSHAHLRAQPEEDSAALERILSLTDAQMNAPETQGRIAAISQLKAAVAATEAARRMGEDSDEDDEGHENAFRDDLRQAVRPRRPVASQDGRAERPRPAPLKLVASQRIDLPQEEDPAAVPAMPVRPRRVSAAPEAPAVAAAATQANSFADFAAEMGAKSLADLLEAAAAYTSFVEGIEDFSRPQLMKKLSTVTAEPFNREDTLRSFGTLLREGRITKSAAAGRFQVSEGTRFHPERRAG